MVKMIASKCSTHFYHSNQAIYDFPHKVLIILLYSYFFLVVILNSTIIIRAFFLLHKMLQIEYKRKLMSEEIQATRRLRVAFTRNSNSNPTSQFWFKEIL